jgi:dTMP kinase
MSQNVEKVKAAPFLVFEGLDGSGKSTLIELLATELKSRGCKVTLTREPGGTPLAEDIRGLLLRTDAEPPVPSTELLLYAAGRAQHVAQVIRPALERGEWVICDRFAASSVAFQCFARGLKRSDVDWLNHFAMGKTEPDLTILLDISVAESRVRQNKRSATDSGVGGDRMEREATKFHESVRLGYQTQAKDNPQTWLVLDAMAAPEQMVVRLIKELGGRGWLNSSTG